MKSRVNWSQRDVRKCRQFLTLRKPAALKLPFFTGPLRFHSKPTDLLTGNRLKITHICVYRVTTYFPLCLVLLLLLRYALWSSLFSCSFRDRWTDDIINLKQTELKEIWNKRFCLWIPIINRKWKIHHAYSSPDIWDCTIYFKPG
jgi:hypothetical protein